MVDRNEKGPEGRDRRHSDEPPDPLKTLLERVERGEHIRAAGERGGREDREALEEEWRAHDRGGPYGQGRRKRN
ncbi:hypothetical protein I5Q34_16575 [Streptomyces sp. AV19]|uniref:hypothetical protein n=1 Tax=Streptomyces sp. AV19 TaxID=2793068 RepID=UPI0018FE849E|nr:hypothetical protein [Streptomyces sp. AV19]MBH1935863.1 hypothetical protein [Streptomyces sp. AV19]MDG4534353.1 hypothetical protein [Streptomyces sp. AV19]